MPTLHYLYEQCHRLIRGGNPSTASPVHEMEIKGAITQVVNSLLRTEYFSATLPGGETIPAGLVLASYDGIPVEKYKNRSRAKLPATPISLPRNMGVFHVGSSTDPDQYYVPMQAGQGQFLKTQGLISGLLGKTGYELEDGHVVFRSDITTSDNDTTVNMQLVVMDAGKYGEYEPLPLPADTEDTVIKMVVQRFLGEPPPDKVVDSGSEPTKTTGR